MVQIQSHHNIKANIILISQESHTDVLRNISPIPSQYNNKDKFITFNGISMPPQGSHESGLKPSTRPSLNNTFQFKSHSSHNSDMHHVPQEYIR